MKEQRVRLAGPGVRPRHKVNDLLTPESYEIKKPSLHISMQEGTITHNRGSTLFE